MWQVLPEGPNVWQLAMHSGIDRDYGGLFGAAGGQQVCSTDRLAVAQVWVIPNLPAWQLSGTTDVAQLKHGAQPQQAKVRSWFDQWYVMQATLITSSSGGQPLPRAGSSTGRRPSQVANLVASPHLQH
jgi:hypothetical protein